MQGIGLLCGTAASVGFLHTLFGPDHYLPFITLSRAGRWSWRKTLLITLTCGLAHVLSSVVLGVIGLTLGIAAFELEAVEARRGDIAGWLLLGFGLTYTTWGVHRAFQNRPHIHLHVHEDGTVHAHDHVHDGAHLHPHFDPHAAGDPSHLGGGVKVSEPERRGRTTPWVLFTIFLFGPCEPLIPLLMAPAALGGWLSVAWVTLTFALVTLATMTALVMLGQNATSMTSLGRMGRFGHALAGLSIFACGVAVKAGT